MIKNQHLKAYTQQKSNAKQRGVEFFITFEEWKQVWLDSGKWDERGRGAEKFCMCRIGDVGCYSVANVFIGLGKHNVRDGNIGKLDSNETRQKKSQSMRGKPHLWSVGDKNPMHRPEVKAKLSAKIGGANHYKAIGVTTPEGFFPTAKQAAIALDIKKSTIEWRARNNKYGFTYGNNLAIA